MRARPNLNVDREITDATSRPAKHALSAAETTDAPCPAFDLKEFKLVHHCHWLGRSLNSKGEPHFCGVENCFDVHKSSKEADLVAHRSPILHYCGLRNGVLVGCRCVVETDRS